MPPGPAFDRLHPAWRSACAEALVSDPHVPVRLGRRGVPAPAVSGFRRHRGLYYGQRADWRFTLDDGRGIHVREFQDRFELHWDRVCPLARPVVHVVADTPWLCATAAALVTAAVWRIKR